MTSLPFIYMFICLFTCSIEVITDQIILLSCSTILYLLLIYLPLNQLPPRIHILHNHNIQQLIYYFWVTTQIKDTISKSLTKIKRTILLLVLRDIFTRRLCGSL